MWYGGVVLSVCVHVALFCLCVCMWRCSVCVCTRRCLLCVLEQVLEQVKRCRPGDTRRLEGASGSENWNGIYGQINESDASNEGRGGWRGKSTGNERVL